MGERLVRNEEVSGSIPLSSTIETIEYGRVQVLRLVCKFYSYRLL